MGLTVDVIISEIARVGVLVDIELQIMLKIENMRKHAYKNRFCMN